MPEQSLLIGDIGGTNARFALADADGAYDQEQTLACADFPAVEDAIRAYIGQLHATPTRICLAVAGPVVGGTVRMTNNHWVISSAELGRHFAVDSVRVLNDFEAAAWSIPLLTAADTQLVGIPEPVDDEGEDRTIAVIGPGTGLGVAGLCRRGGAYVPIVGEGGHVGFAPATRVQIDVLAALRERFDRVSAERLLSGAGIAEIYWALCRLHGERRLQLDAAKVFAASADGDPRALEATQLFFEILGQVAGDLALTLGAVDGVYIAGGIAKRYPEQLQASGFRSAFESKGRHRALMEKIPTLLVTHAEPGLLGAAHCAATLSL